MKPWEPAWDQDLKPSPLPLPLQHCKGNQLYWAWKSLNVAMFCLQGRIWWTLITSHYIALVQWHLTDKRNREFMVVSDFYHESTVTSVQDKLRTFNWEWQKKIDWDFLSSINKLFGTFTDNQFHSLQVGFCSSLRWRLQEINKWYTISITFPEAPHSGERYNHITIYCLYI